MVARDDSPRAQTCTQTGPGFKNTTSTEGSPRKGGEKVAGDGKKERNFGGGAAGARSSASFFFSSSANFDFGQFSDVEFSDAGWGPEGWGPKGGLFRPAPLWANASLGQRTLRPRRVKAPFSEKVEARRVEPRRVGFPKAEGWRPKILCFFPLPPQFSFFSPSLVVPFVEFCWCLKRPGVQMCTFGVLWLSCEPPGPEAAGVSLSNPRGQT